jgi:hypothetical protein
VAYAERTGRQHPMISDTSDQTGAPAASAESAPRPAPPVVNVVSPMWRGIVLIAVISLFVGVYATWADPWTALVVMIGYGGLLACAVLAVTVRRPAAMRRLEYGVLGLAIALYIASLPHLFPRSNNPPYAGDEGILLDRAGFALYRHADLYALAWPHAVAGRSIGITLTLSGQVVSRYQYPPIAAILDAMVKPLTPGLPTAGIIAAVALGVTTLLMFFLLPSPWRAVAPMVCLGLGIYQPDVWAGAPVMVMLPLLILALYRWTSIGSGGRLGRGGWMSAVCLGLAAAVHQLAWFIVPFLLMAIFLVRRADVPRREAARLAGAYAAVAGATFAVVNVPFMIWNFGDWLSGIGAPVTQAAVPYGQGLVGITYYFTGGSGALSFYSYAALLYAIALLICFGLWFKRLGPAVAILPWTILFFPSRSLSGYFTVFVALWVVSLLTIDYGVFVRARGPRPLFQGTGARAAVVAALFLPAAVCLAIAAGTPQPLRLTVAPLSPTGRIAALTVTATNTSGGDIAPHFALQAGASPTAVWIIRRGPATLRRGATATYLIEAPFALATASRHVPVELRVFSASPDTLSTATVTSGSALPR